MYPLIEMNLDYLFHRLQIFDTKLKKLFIEININKKIFYTSRMSILSNQRRTSEPSSVSER
jgi:hypothetical protein